MALREGNMGTGQSRRLTLAGILLLAGMQSHAGDLSFFHEIPHGSEADISQTGADLMAYVEQTGNNQASVDQQGHAHDTRIVQQGYANQADVIQYGSDQQADITQLGWENLAVVAQYGIGNSVTHSRPPHAH